MKKKFTNLLCTVLTAACTLSIVPVSSAGAVTLYKSDGTKVEKSGEQIKGTENGYSYELWNQYDKGQTTMKLGQNGAFSCEWSNIENVLFRRGVDFDCTKTYKQIGDITFDYAADYNNPTQNTYLCVYGWTRDPLIEYYIVDSWGSWRPPGANSSKGTITVDGGKYDVYVTDRINQPSIDGNTTFKQYWSVRQTKRTSGKISVSKHFAEWEKLGMQTGKLYEAALNVEGYQSSGKANVKKNVVTVGGSPSDPQETTEPTTEEPITEPDKNGYYFNSTFDSGTDDFTPRGSAKINPSGGVLNVTGRTDSWNGACIALDPAAFKAGKSYSFSSMVKQDSTSSEDFKLTLQYSKDGEENYATVAKATGKTGEWVQLYNPSFEIPEGAADLILYVETADSTTDFSIDDAIGAKEGTVINPSKENDSGPTKLYGDVNLDGAVTSADASLLQKFILVKNVKINSELADLNGDKKINAKDLTLLKIKLNKPKSTTTKESQAQTTTTTTKSNDDTIDPSKPMVAISFDDGAVGTAANSSSMRILNALAKENFHSTFFYVGNWVNNSDKEAEVKKAYSMGMEVANHTMSHPDLTKKSASDIRNEYDSCSKKLEGIIGTKPSPLLRLPYLAQNDTVRTTLSDVPMITAAVDFQDWNGASTEQIVNTVKTAAANGSLKNSIVLAHETYDTTAEAMEILCPYLKSQGWQVVTVSDLFKANGKELKGGQVYTRCH